MVVNKKVVTVETFNSEIEDGEQLQAELFYAMLEHKKFKRMIDIFTLLLFLTFILYTII